MGLFGGKRAAPPSTTRAHATTHGNKEPEELLSPKSSSTLALPAMNDVAITRRSPSPLPFDLQSAMEAMQLDDDQGGHLSAIVNSTALHLANLLNTDDIFANTPKETPSSIRSEDIRTLYIRAVAFANQKTDPNLRTSAVRMLAALIATYPPPHSAVYEKENVLPDTITIRSLYKIIVSPVTAASASSHIDAVFVQVGALKALCKNGKDVDGLDGIVGWLIRCLEELTEEFASWCVKKDEWEGKKVNACEAVIAIIELLHPIVLHQAPVFAPTDLTRVVQPIIDLLIAGIVSATAHISPEDHGHSHASRRSSPLASAINSPMMGGSGLGLEQSLRHSIIFSNRSRKESSSVGGTPRLSAVPQSVPVDAKWTRPISSFCSFIDTLISETTLSDDLFKNIILFLCLCFGQDEAEYVPESTWNALYDVLQAMLSPKGGRRGEQILNHILEGKLQLKNAVPEADRKIARGAVISSRSLLHHLNTSTGDNAINAGAMSTLGPYLRAAQSTSRFLGDNRSAERVRWQPVDIEILALLQDHIYWLDGANGGESNKAADVWTEGQTACDLLHGMVPVAMSPDSSRRTSDNGDDHDPLKAMFQAIVHHLPQALGRLYPSSSTAPLFFHPKYIDLLLDISTHLDEDDAGVVIDFYQRECLCLPFTSNWIRNIWRLLEAFFLPANTRVSIRKKITTLLFRDVYHYAEDLPEHRNELVEKVLIPFLEMVLTDEPEEEFVEDVLAVLVNAAVAETMERDEERRRDRATKAPEENEQEDDAILPSEKIKAAATGGSFDAIRSLIIKLASQTACKEVVSGKIRDAASANSSPALREDSMLSRKSSLRSREASAPSGLRGLVDALSPPKQHKDLPNIATVASPSGDENITSSPTFEASRRGEQSSDALPSHSPHTDCRSLHAVTALIAIFIRLAFSPPHSFDPAVAAVRTPASSRCITVYRDLLGLLYPMTDGSQTPSANKIPSRCPRSRVVILQFLTRLRADGKHRIYMRQGMDRAVTPFAAILKRTKDTEKTEMEESQRRGGRGSARAEVEERGRAPRVQVDTSVRSRSRSKAAISRVTAGAMADAYAPLWSIPDTIAFEIPLDASPSQGMTTYDPNHPSLKDPSAPPVEGVWLPVSEYVRVLNGILRGHDWELVSYVLTFLPIQLTNKLFFHGVRATREIRALLDVLSTGVLGGSTPWEKRFNVPSYIKRADINAAAYQSLSILISYRGVFNRLETDRLIQAFMAGLQGKEQLAKPCLQALTLSVYELEQSVSRNLTEIIRALTNILSTTGLAVHILEFLLALGQNASLFRNFTDEQYRLVFRVAIGYITEHNARSDNTVDLRESSTQEAYILSQHVIGLAYYAIYIWFLALRLPQRPSLVTEITREVLKGRSQRVLLDEMAEVCFDWLARYTYGNADPRPATSFLSDVVMSGKDEETKSGSWMLGGAIITVTSHSRSGWATITTTRPTGTTVVVCKIENVPLVGLGEANADLVSLPAVLMANRDPKIGGSKDASDLPDPKQIVDAESIEVREGDFDQSSQHGHIWSGATPSQRRKDVVVDPSYLALQLLSSYPNASLDTPRGRLIPPEEKFARALRGIQNTPVIDNLKIAVIYVGPGQTNETEILGNIDGSPLYLDFLSGLGRLIRLKGQMDVFVGGLNRDNDSDGEYAYAWWDDLSQMVFHTPTMMPNLDAYPNYENKKRLVGNDYIKIVYNDSGKEFAFDTIKTAWNFINIVISPFNTGAGEDELPRGSYASEWRKPVVTSSTTDEGWLDWDREDWFKVTVQRIDGIPDFSPIGTHKLVSRRALPVLVRQFAHLANDLAARFVHIRDAADAPSAEYITSWRSRLRGMHRLQAMLPPVELPDENDLAAREYMVRDFTRLFSYQPPPKKEE